MQKWMQTVLEVENLKPLSDTHSWTLLTQSCMALSTLFNVFPLTHKVIHKQGATCTLQDSFNNVVNLNAEQGWGQDATLWDSHLLLVQLRQSGTHSNLKRTLV